MVSRIWDSSKKRSREILEYLDTAALQMLSEALDAMLDYARGSREDTATKAGTGEGR
jgi:hypothetical protein